MRAIATCLASTVECASPAVQTCLLARPGDGERDSWEDMACAALRDATLGAPLMFRTTPYPHGRSPTHNLLTGSTATVRVTCAGRPFRQPRDPCHRGSYGRAPVTCTRPSEYHLTATGHHELYGVGCATATNRCVASP